MNTLLYQIVDYITKIHNDLLTLNDAYEANFTDKQLHFIVIGLVGMAMVLVIHPIFKFFANRGAVMAITWIYVFTLIILMTFAIEIGQKITHTGVMDFNDIVFGVWGFLLMFAIFLAVRFIIKSIVNLFRRT